MFPHTFKFQVVLEIFFNDFYDILPCNTLTLPQHLWPRPTPEGNDTPIIFYSSSLKQDVVLLSYTLAFPWPRVICAKLVEIDLVILQEKTKIYKFITTSTTTDNGHIFIRKTQLTFRLSLAKNYIIFNIFVSLCYFSSLYNL